MSDIFKAIPLRIVGFSFGIGQAAKYRFSAKKVDSLNGVGVFFVVAHLVHNAVTEKSVPGFVRTLCFEGICTCIIPPVINYYLCRFVAEVLWDIRAIPTVVKKWAPFVFGLLTIPVLMLYVDPDVDIFINSLISG